MASTDTTATTSPFTSTVSPDAGGGGGGGDATAWLHDPTLWTPVTSPLEAECAIREARLPSSAIPRRTWTSCGVGCSVAPVPLPNSNQISAIWSGVTASEEDGEIYYRVSTGGDYHTGYGIDEIRKLSSDDPVVVLRHSGKCFAITGLFSPFVLVIQYIIPYEELGNGPERPLSIGKAARQVGAAVSWAQPGLESGSGDEVYFDLQSHWGVIRDSSVVQVAMTEGSSALTTVFSSPAFQIHPAQRDDVLVWIDWSNWSPPAQRAQIRVWTPSNGSAPLARGEGDIVEVAITDDRLVWMEATGLGSIQGTYESARFVYSPRTTVASEVQRTLGPVIPHTETATQGLVAYGDFAATVVSSENGAGVVVANLVSHEIWVIPDRPGNVFFDVMAMNATSLLVKETTAGSPEMEMERLVRLDLSKLDALANGWE